MKRLFALIALLHMGFSQADSPLVPPNFFDEYLCEQKQDLADAGMTSACPAGTVSPPGPPGPPPPPPPPPVNPIPPAPVTGYFPVVFSNQTGQPDDQIYILGVYNSNTQFLTLSGAPFPGAMSTVSISPTTYSASPFYSYPLTSLPKSTTGATTGNHDYLVYLPPVSASGGNGRIYFSIGNPLYALTQSTVSISIGNAFNDPNYNVLYDFAEIAYQYPITPAGPGDIDWTATIDTTQVDSFSLPIKLGFFDYQSGSPSAIVPFTPANSNTSPGGFSTNRDTLINAITSGLTAPYWNQLALPFRTDPYNTSSSPTTYLRILSPKNGGPPPSQPLGNYQLPIFPLDYLSNAAYGINYLNTLYTYYASSGSESLYIQADTTGGSGQIYKGQTSGGTFSFTSTTDATNIITLAQGSITLNQMFSGNPPMIGSGSTPGGDLGLIKDYFASAFIVGLLGQTNLYNTVGAPLNGTSLTAHKPTTASPSLPYYTPPPAPFSPGIWYDLFAQVLHANAIMPASPAVSPPLPTVGLCYAYDFDDTLGMSSALAPPASTQANQFNLYAILTLGPVPTLPSGVFDDSASYTLTFTFPGGNTFGYRQGSSGSFTTWTSGTPIPTSVTSTNANPFQIQYNGNIYTVFPKYQFLRPIDQYTTPQSAIVNGVTFTPNSVSAPTAFTIALPGA